MVDIELSLGGPPGEKVRETACKCLGACQLSSRSSTVLDPSRGCEHVAMAARPEPPKRNARARVRKHSFHFSSMHHFPSVRQFVADNITVSLRDPSYLKTMFEHRFLSCQEKNKGGALYHLTVRPARKARLHR